MTQPIEINRAKFTPLPGVRYKHDYVRIAQDIARGKLPSRETLRTLVLEDLWFVVYFVLKVGVANHPFWVSACREVEEGPKSKTLDLWAREHGKSTIITTAETIQTICRDKEERVGIFSHTRPVAKGFLRSIKLVAEESLLLKQCFPDVLYENPAQESPKWSEDDGLIFKREGFYKESTVEAWGLIEGMPTGKHFTTRVYDDIETADVVENPDTVRKLVDRFDLSQNLGTQDGRERVIGTFYSHNGVLTYLRDKKNIHGENIYTTRIKAATSDGTPNGNPVLFTQKKLDELKSNEYVFNCQQLLNPTPIGTQKLDSSRLMDIEPKFIPSAALKFMVIDPAGSGGDGDSWGIHVCAVDPKVDDIGASSVYIVDSCIEPMNDSEAIEQIVRMYLRNGMIQKVGIEKVALSTTEIHVANALKAKGRHISVDNGSLVILKPAGRKKVDRIEAALAWPLNNSKLFISTAVPTVYRERLRAEMDKFPYWFDDGLDSLSYLYDIIKDYKFQRAVIPKIQYKEMGIV